MKILSMVLFVVFGFAVVSCDQGPNAPWGFSLPEGNAEQGKLVFKHYQCLSCHTLEGMELGDIENNPDISVKLGGKSTKVKTYAELVTSIINPSHRLAVGYPKDMIQLDKHSKMPVYNDVMTVTELIDLVSFLQTQYVLVPYRRTPYYEYLR
ncbi:c-type cytochrome [Thalassotalea aquiviva]|uniref:c-type cytochrome n=1 Tax=Thalassotalea aquiviva TaxID=3242415 RepID=UPI00352B226D